MPIKIIGLIVTVIGLAFAGNYLAEKQGLQIPNVSLPESITENQIVQKPLAMVKGITFSKNENHATKSGTSNSNNSTESLAQSAQEQLQQTVERTKVLGEQTQTAIQQVVQEKETDPDSELHERALEYGQYLYCKQVVESYETDSK